MNTVRKDGGNRSSIKQRHQPYLPTRSKQNEKPLKTEGKRKIQGHKAKNNGFFGNSPIFFFPFFNKQIESFLSFASNSFFQPSRAFLSVAILNNIFSFYVCVYVCRVCATSFFFFFHLFIYVSLCHYQYLSGECDLSLDGCVFGCFLNEKKVSLPFRCQI